MLFAQLPSAMWLAGEAPRTRLTSRRNGPRAQELQPRCSDWLHPATPAAKIDSHRWSGIINLHHRPGPQLDTTLTRVSKLPNPAEISTPAQLDAGDCQKFACNKSGWSASPAARAIALLIDTHFSTGRHNAVDQLSPGALGAPFAGSRRKGSRSHQDSRRRLRGGH